jgi:hypothetical protein
LPNILSKEFFIAFERYITKKTLFTTTLCVCRQYLVETKGSRWI